VTKILASLGKKRPKVVTIGVAGNWLIPDNYVRASRLVAKALGEADPKGASYYKARLKTLEAECGAVAADAKARAKRAGASRTKVICADQQCELVEWLGFDVAMTYGRSDELTPKVLSDLARTGRAARVRLVIDNLQSGPTTGRQLAADIGAAHVSLSSFPGGFKGTDTWQRLIRDNVNRLMQGLQRLKK
jgi:zinc transport system substrate-binding protein